MERNVRRLFYVVTMAGVLALVMSVGCPVPYDVPYDIYQKEQAVFNQVNYERVLRRLDALVMDERLREVARAHSQDMVLRDFFSHVNPDGDDPFDRIRSGGVSYNIAGENIAWNNYPDPAEVAVEGWMDSPGHRENILRSEFTCTGVGVASDGEGGYYFTQVFIGVSKGVPRGYVDLYYSEPSAQQSLIPLQ
jgi:uncharacterized protein YkwD